jgi:2-keto-4-pentenoate hydratase/2-oxohepta-3-ene-1,7-dioic acid hydratase in catechol pathway
MRKGRVKVEGKIKKVEVRGNSLIGPDRSYKLNEVNILPPIDPGKIIGVGNNYPKQGKKTSNSPIFFLKPKTSLVSQGDDIRYPETARDLIYEGELGVVIAKECSNIDPTQAMEYIQGFTCVNDITDIERLNEFQILPAKGIDNTCPVGPFIQTDLELPVFLETRVNGERRQYASTADMIHSIDDIIAKISSFMTLNKNDIILTGTPSGTRPLEIGQKISVKIEDVGTLKNQIKPA